MYLNKDRALRVMEQNNLDALVATIPKNVGYLSSYFPLGEGTFETFAILPRSSSIPATLVVGHSTLPGVAANPTWMPHLISYEETHWNTIHPQPGIPFDNPWLTAPEFEPEMRRLMKDAHNAGTHDGLKALAGGLRDLGLEKARLGFDDLHLAEALKEQHLPDLKVTGGRHHLVDIRIVKTPEELGIIRHAAQINEDSIQESLKSAREGMQPGEQMTKYRIAVAERGGLSSVGLPGFSWGGQFDDPLKKGALFPIIGVCTYKRYGTDLLRTIVVGPPTPSQARLHGAVMGAWSTLDAAIRPGLNTNDIFGIVRQSFAELGGDGGQLAIYVHGIGLDSYENNHHERQEGFVLEENMVFCVFMVHMAHQDGGGIFLEEQILVTKDGCEQLFTLPRDLITVQ